MMTAHLLKKTSEEGRSLRAPPLAPNRSPKQWGAARGCSVSRSLYLQMPGAAESSPRPKLAGRPLAPALVAPESLPVCATEPGGSAHLDVPLRRGTCRVVRG